MIKSSFPIKLKTLREQRGLSQKGMANLIGVSKQNVCDWENEKSQTSFENLEKIAKALQVTADYLIETYDTDND